MTETQREPVPRVDTCELDTALAFLSFARHCVLKKADGLSDEQLRRVLVDSGTSILGLVQHLAEAERYWFGHHLAGAAWDADQEHGMTVSTNRSAGDVLRDGSAGGPGRGCLNSGPAAVQKHVAMLALRVRQPDAEDQRPWKGGDPRVGLVRKLLSVR